ncbi:MAG: yaeI2 [Deltaproteobacteria bacterium]|nr:yaeI2 [Deltaproteobacteria bacterium]
MGQWAGFFIFFSLVTSIYAVAHYYLYGWVVRLTEPPKILRRAAAIAFVFLVISFPASRILSWRDFNAFSYLLMLVSSVWMGLVLYLFIFALASDLLGAFVKIFRLKSWLLGRNPLRVKRYLFAGIIATVFLIGAFSLDEAGNIRITNLEIRLAGLPQELDGFTIAQISDFHFGVLNNTPKLERVVTLANSLKADLIFLTGDVVDESVAHMEEMAGPLAKLRGKTGVYGITGNHDYYAGVNRVTGIMKEAGITVLRNELKILPGGLQLLGIDDPTGVRRMGEKGEDFISLIAKVDPSKPSILLYHQPIQFERTARAGIGLQLSGHTHGGQLYPIIYISKRIYPWTPGLHRLGKSLLYVSRGTGTWGPPMRFLAPPEIVHIKLLAQKK